MSHYRSPHAPFRKYVDPSLTIADMYKHYKSKCSTSHVRCVSLAKYKSKKKTMNISFAKLGHEACESCTKNELHLSERSEDCEPECEHCVTFQEHKRRGGAHDYQWRLLGTNGD